MNIFLNLKTLKVEKEIRSKINKSCQTLYSSKSMNEVKYFHYSFIMTLFYQEDNEQKKGLNSTLSLGIKGTGRDDIEELT